MTYLARLGVSALLAALSLAALEHDADALGPVDIELGARGGVGTKPASGGASPFGLGLGGRAGVSVFHFYGGISAIHYFGSSTDLPTPPGTVNSRYSSTLVGVELGYSITIVPKLLIRPQLGIGNASFAFGDDASQSHLYLEPGVVALLLLGNLYLGADANILAVPGISRGNDETRTYASLTAHVQIGLRF